MTCTSIEIINLIHTDDFDVQLLFAGAPRNAIDVKLKFMPTKRELFLLDL